MGTSVLQQTPTQAPQLLPVNNRERVVQNTVHSNQLTAKMNHLLLVSLVTLASLPSLLALPKTCAGCPEQTEVDQEIVDFVMAELSYGDCARNSLAVTNFQSQVVAGLRYKFDLEAAASTQCGDGAAESCHVEVYSVPWRGTKEIIWDATTCTRPGEEMEERQPSGHWPPTQQ